MKVSVIIPTYNEEKAIRRCLESLSKQDYKNVEIIVVDDGSQDDTFSLISNFQFSIFNKTILNQNHLGPGSARNLGAGKSHGEILVFVDADMEFDKDFISKLVQPIIDEKSIGTFSKDEYLLNKNNSMARCWNLNLGRDADRMISGNYPDESPVFRAILKSKFLSAGGFDTNIGYTDDWSLSRKLGVMAVYAPEAIFYHRNPETLHEVWIQARWFGKNEFLTGSLLRRVFNLLRYNPLLAVLLGIIGIIRYREQDFLSFKIVYDTAVFTSVIGSFVSEPKYK